VPRLYGPGHFTEDPHSHIVSPHGIPVECATNYLRPIIGTARNLSRSIAATKRTTERAIRRGGLPVPFAGRPSPRRRLRWGHLAGQSGLRYVDHEINGIENCHPLARVDDPDAVRAGRRSTTKPGSTGSVGA
jgi:hypothetical protein